MNKELDRIAQRQGEIAKAMEALQREAEELAIAQRVVMRLKSPQESKPATGSSSQGKPRPKGAPTLFEMTTSVLIDAEKAGKDGLVSKELIAGIRDKYWPGLATRQVLPSIYGFVNSKRLHKTEGGKFKRLKVADE